jgi:hypothetical protein
MAKAITQQKAKRAPLSAEEKTPRGAFVRLAQGRMGQALKAIRALANLAGTQYEYTPADVEKMRTALAAELTTTFRRLNERKATAKASGFTL